MGARESPAHNTPFTPTENLGTDEQDLDAQIGHSFARRRSSLLDANNEQNEPREVQNARAVQVLSRVKEKLTGHDFKANEELSVGDQVDKLLVQATSVENLCQHYIGWCSFW